MDLISSIRIPDGIDGTFLEGLCEYAYMKTRDTMPFKTGWMSRECFTYTITDKYIILLIPGDKCPYAEYLQYDIPRTMGFFDRSTRIFECYIKMDFEQAERLSHTTEDLYGLKYNNMREINKLLKYFEDLDQNLYIK